MQNSTAGRLDIDEEKTAPGIRDELATREADSITSVLLDKIELRAMVPIHEHYRFQVNIVVPRRRAVDDHWSKDAGIILCTVVSVAPRRSILCSSPWQVNSLGQ